jgi:hypothetical protein
MRAGWIKTAGRASYSIPTLLAACALFSNFLLQTRYDPDIELLSEIICWIALAILIYCLARFDSASHGEEVFYDELVSYPALLAGGIVAASICRAIEDVRWVIVRRPFSIRTSARPIQP